MSNAPKGESSAAIRERVIKARQIQEERFKGIKGIHCNAQMNSTLLHKYAQLDAPSNELLIRAMTHLNLSARAYERILKVARTIADLAGSENIERTTSPKPSATAPSTASPGWNKQQMAELYATSKPNIRLYMTNILKENELNEFSVVKEYLTTAADGKNY